MAWIWLFFVLFAAFQPCVICKPGLRLLHSGSKEFYSVEYISENRTCDEMELYKWYQGFHECFMDRKYKDGGQDLNSIIDRILDHADTCVEESRRDCQLNFNGFKFILKKVIEQMKDYSTMYLEDIRKGREDIKDLDCVENTLSLQTYESCFEVKLLNLNLSESELQKVVHEGLLCANRRNWGCSREAKTTFNRIIRTLLGVKHPRVEYLEEYEPTTTPAPPVMRWYDYIFQPFISAWSFIKSIFG